MRNINKLDEPAVLEQNKASWLAQLLEDRASNYRKTKYRHPEIKTALVTETGSKCVYCESKIGHNTPGDVEHKVPVSFNIERIFEWSNLTIACTECNRRKNDYFEEDNEFLDPYTDNVESMLEHHGPLVYWNIGNSRAEITIRILELNDASRTNLILRKTRVLEDASNLIERWNSETNRVLRSLLMKKAEEMVNVKSEYSAMVYSFFNSKGFELA